MQKSNDLIAIFASTKNNNIIMESIRNRRTIRKYKQQDIPNELLNEILETSCRASTMGGLQLYSVIVTRSAEMKEKLSPLHFNQPMVKNAPVVLTFCADYNRTSVWCRNRKATPGYDNFESFFNAAIDALLVAQNFCTIAEDKGLGICYLGTTTYTPQQIIDVLNLPKLVYPVATITVGYPDEMPNQPDRLPLEAIIHNETYKQYSAEDIDRYYSYKESLEENKHFVEINNTETLAQIFTDIRYKKEDNEAASKAMLEALKNQGFID